MAQTGFTPIQLYSTSTAAAAPVAGNLTNSTLGSELAINITDGKLFYKDNANAVQVIGWKTVPTTAGGTGLTTYTAGDLSYYATGTTFTKLAIGTIGQILTSTGSAPQWTTLSGVAVTTFSAGTTGFTPNSATSGAVTLAGTLATTNGGTGLTAFTANRVFYASSTSAIGSSANLTFNGTTLTANDITDSSLTSGRVTYASTGGNLIDSANLTFTGTNLAVGGVTAQTFLTLNASATATQLSGYASTTFIYGLGRIANGLALDSFDYIDFFTGSGSGPRTGTAKARMFASGGVSIGNTTDPGASNLFVTGSVGIGTTIPAVKLDIRGTTGASSTVRIGSDSNDMGTIQFFNTTGSTVNSTISGNLEAGNAGGDLRFATKTTAGSLTEQMRITAAGNINAVTGNVVMSTSGKGIDFAAAGGTVLSYYEQSTFTATLTGCTTSPTVTATATRVGRLVTINIPAISGTSNSTSKSITGIPAQFRPANQQRGFVNLISDNGGANTPASLFIEAAGTISLFAGPNNNNWTASGTCIIQNMNLTYQFNV